MTVNTKSNQPLIINSYSVEEVQGFTYLGSKITVDGDSGADVQERFSKARGAFAVLSNIRKASRTSPNTKLRIFKSNVLGVFQTRCLRRILKICWPRTISNDDLYRKTNMTPLSNVIKNGRWTWIGHVCRMDLSAIPRVAMRWTLPGTRKRG